MNAVGDRSATWARWLRGEAGWCLGLLSIFLTLRIVFLVCSQIELYHPEEYLNLRLFRQLAEGLPPGSLGQYAYGAGSGLDGGGTVVQSVLYLPLALLLGPTQLAVKSMALLWAVAGALACAAVGRRLFGRGGAAAALAAMLALPPAYLVFSSISWANHVEGAVLTIATLWVLLVLSDRVESGGGQVWSVMLGVLIVAVPCYSPLALLPLGFVVLGLPWCMASHRTRSLPWMILGAAIGLGVAMLAGLDARQISGVASGLGHYSSGVLGDTGSRFLEIVGAPATVATYGVHWPGRWELPATALPILHVTCCALGLAGSLALAVWAFRRHRGDRDPRKRAARLVFAVIALDCVLLPVVLTIFDAGIPRRLSPVYLCWALGWAGLITQVTTRAPRMIALPSITLCVGMGLLPGLLLAMSGHPPTAPFSPHRFVLLPRAAPVVELSAGLSDVTEDHLPALNALLDDPRATDPDHLTAALVGFDMAAGGPRDPLELGPRRCADGVAAHARWFEVTPAMESITWEYYGVGAAVGCGADVAAARCEEPPEAEHWRACMAGVARSRPGG